MCLATAFSCPFEGIVDEGAVLAIIEDSRITQVDDIVVCDTIGQAVPARVRRLVSRLVAGSPNCRIGFHGHDTWAMGVANTLAAIDNGARLVDGCLGRLGGCPFVPGASGNTATEDIIFALQPEWAGAEVFTEIARLSEHLLARLGEPDRSRASRALRASPNLALEDLLPPPQDRKGLRETRFSESNPITASDQGVR